MIHYRIELHNLQAHQYRVSLTVPNPAPQQVLSLPVWIPGSYLVREFARHLSGLQATQGERSVVLEQLDKASWRAHCDGRTALTVHCLVYAFDPSVRAAFLDPSRGFFNGTSLCLRVEGREAEPHGLTLARLPRGWSVATSMPADGPRGHLAADYDELVDHPFALGNFWQGRFEACGVPHAFVVGGAWPGFDSERLLADARRICETQIAFWHGKRDPKPPFERFVFLLQAVDEGYGGLEHRASTALVCARRDLPRADAASNAEGYSGLLGLVSHEYFHSWNVKRMKPRSFARLDYTRENATPLLWFFEGFTSYYDDLLLLRAGLLDATRYLTGVAKSMNGLAGLPGRLVQSVAQASFDAWTKHYRPDENTANASVSYYTKGALVALALDLTLRKERHGNLDAVMQRLWRKAENAQSGAIDEADIAAALREVGGRGYEDELAHWVHGTVELPLPVLLDEFGVSLRSATLPFAATLGLRLSEGALSGVHVKAVAAGSAASEAGVAAGDELLAVDGWRIRRLDDARQWLVPDTAFELLLVRDQRVLALRVQPPPAPATALTLSLADKPSATAASLRRAWLGA